MKKDTITSIILGIIGILSTFIAVYELETGIFRTISIIFLLLLIAIIIFRWFWVRIDFLNGWRILRQTNQLGIRGIYTKPIDISKEMIKGENIRIMCVSADALIRSIRNDIIFTLRNNRAIIRILLAQPDSDFIKDLEEIESPHRTGEIKGEVGTVKNLLAEIMDVASENLRYDDIGRIKLGYFTTQFRSSVITCDENFGWITLNLPPKRAMQSVSLLLCKKNDSLLDDCIAHFDRCWDIIESRGDTIEIIPTQYKP